MAGKPEDLDAFADFTEVRGSMSHRMEHPEEYLEAASEEETPEAREAREAVEAAAAAAEAETPEEKAAREAAEAAAVAETPEQKVAREAAEAEADKTKDWTIDDYKKHRRESEARMHAATGETAKEKTAREAAEAEATELKAKLAEKEAAAAKPPEISIEEKENQLLAQMIEIRTKAAREIADLDRSDPDQYYKDWSTINSKADLEIKRAERKLGLVGQAEDIGQAVKTEVEANLKKERDADEARRAETRENDEKAENARVWQNAQDLAIKAGLDLKNRTIMASFWAYADELPEDLYPKPVEEKVAWLVAQVRADLGIVVNQTDEERKLALENQKRNQLLGKGGKAPLKEEFKPKSFSERLENISP